MSDVDDEIQRRGLAGILLLVVPIVSIVAVGIAYVVTFTVGMQGRQADGPLVRVPFQGCVEAAPLVRARAEAMGLPELAEEPEPGGFALVMRMPSDTEAAAGIPATLARPGTFLVRAGEDGEVLATEADIDSAAVEMAFLDVPHAQIVLKPEAARRLLEHQKSHVDGAITVWLDGARVQTFRNVPALDEGEIDLDLVGASDRERITFAAATAVVLSSGPLPCDVVAGEAVPLRP